MAEEADETDTGEAEQGGKGGKGLIIGLVALLLLGGGGFGAWKFFGGKAHAKAATVETLPFTPGIPENDRLAIASCWEDLFGGWMA